VPVHDQQDGMTATVAGVLAAADRLAAARAGSSAEVVLVDDGSTDATPAIADDLAAADERITVIHQANAGVSAARNAGARAATARTLVFLDGDDRVDPDWLVAFDDARRGPVRPALVFCEATAVQPGGREERWRPRSLGPAYENITGIFNPGTFCVDRDVFLDVGGYAVGMKFGENYELALRLVARLALDATPVPTAIVGRQLVRFEIPDRPGGSNAYSNQTRFDSAVYLAEIHGPRLARVDPAFVAQSWAIAGVAAARLGRGADSRRCFWHAVRLEPRQPRHLARAAVATVPAVRRRLWPSRT
jgi:glycosyltransferase involved in cell wall biosynthesis